MKKLISVLMIFSMLFCCLAMSCSFAAEEVTQETVITKQEKKDKTIKNVILGALGAVCVGLGACIFSILRKVDNAAKEVDVLYKIVTTPRVPEKTWEEKTWKEQLETILNDPNVKMVWNSIKFVLIQTGVNKLLSAFSRRAARRAGLPLGRPRASSMPARFLPVVPNRASSVPLN